MNALNRFTWFIAAAVLFVAVNTTQAFCPFCETEKGPTLTGEFEQAHIILYGHFENPRFAKNGIDPGESDFVIEEVIKPHDMVKGKKILTLPKAIIDPKVKFIVFFEIYEGKLDPYKGVQLTKDSEMRQYLTGAVKLKDKKQPERLRYAFDFLNSPEIEVALDAYREFAKADYGDYKEIAKKLPADKIAGWLKDPKTPSFRYGLYASLLGHCGGAKDAELLLSMIQDPEKRQGSGLHGLMAAYTMLDTAKGWNMVKSLVRDAEQPFLVRFAGLQTMRFFWESRPDLIAKDDTSARAEIVKGLAGVLEVADMADFAIEDLRRWKRWEFCDQIIGMFGQKTYNTPIIRKSILRYAIQCPNKRAVEFVAEQRKRDAEWVTDTRELLDLETPAAVTSTTRKK